MPYFRHRSFVFAPVYATLSTAMICSSVNRRLFIRLLTDEHTLLHSGTNLGEQTTLAIHRAEQQQERVELTKCVATIANNSAKALKHVSEKLRNREAVHAAGDGELYVDLEEIRRIDNALANIPLHTVPSSLVTPTMILSSTIRQFLCKVEMALQLHRKLGAPEFEDFFPDTRPNERKPRRDLRGHRDGGTQGTMRGLGHPGARLRVQRSALLLRMLAPLAHCPSARSPGRCRDCRKSHRRKIPSKKLEWQIGPIVFRYSFACRVPQCPFDVLRRHSCLLKQIFHKMAKRIQDLPIISDSYGALIATEEFAERSA